MPTRLEIIRGKVVKDLETRLEGKTSTTIDAQFAAMKQQLFTELRQELIAYIDNYILAEIDVPETER